MASYIVGGGPDKTCLWKQTATVLDTVERCRSVGGRLATVHSDAENAFVASEYGLTENTPI